MVKDDFLYRMREDNIVFPVAYRFCWIFRQGEKFCIDTNQHARWYVTNYQEDRGPMQEEMIERANKKTRGIASVHM